MYTKQFCSWLSGLGLGICLATQALAASPILLDKGSITSGWLTDSDGDGVDDAVDLCPGTPIGTAVNGYGCPLNAASCDYTTSTVTLMSTGGSSGSTVSTQYVLADNTGKILQVSPTPTFNGLSGTATYMALALTYDGSATNLSIGSALSAVSASCFDWSNALAFKACVAAPPTCDYQIGETITLKTASGSTGAGIVTQYVLTNASGVIVKLGSTPSFATTGLSAGTYTAYAVTYNDDGSLQNLSVNGSNTIGLVTANCLSKSAGLTLQLCGGCVPICLPMVVTRIKP
jgi:hypothetical protein